MGYYTVEPLDFEATPEQARLVIGGEVRAFRASLNLFIKVAMMC